MVAARQVRRQRVRFVPISNIHLASCSSHAAIVFVRPEPAILVRALRVSAERLSGLVRDLTRTSLLGYRLPTRLRACSTLSARTDALKLAAPLRTLIETFTIRITRFLSVRCLLCRGI